MKNFNTFIVEKLRINKENKFNQYNALYKKDYHIFRVDFYVENDNITINIINPKTLRCSSDNPKKGSLSYVTSNTIGSSNYKILDDHYEGIPYTINGEKRVQLFFSLKDGIDFLNNLKNMTINDLYKNYFSSVNDWILKYNLVIPDKSKIQYFLKCTKEAINLDAEVIEESEKYYQECNDYINSHKKEIDNLNVPDIIDSLCAMFEHGLPYTQGPKCFISCMNKLLDK